MAILENKTADERQVENDLVGLLGFEKFDFIKLLLRNRLKIVYCTRLIHADGETARSAIEEEMRADPVLDDILNALSHSGRSKKADSKSTATSRASSAGTVRGRQEEGGEGRTNKLLDFDELSFSQGSHTMSNKQCHLPPGSFRKQKKGYEEVHVPAMKAPAFKDDEKLVAVEDMPDWAQKGFEGVKRLNRIQSRLYEAAFKSYENLLLCAPTGAGKTNVAMLCILREIGLNMDNEGNLDLENFKIIYVAPMKALVTEIVGNFQSRLQGYGITVPN